MEQRRIKAVVVDDETNARKILPMLIDWSACGYEFAGEASNGNEALDLIEAVRPDVVFTDINMPYMDGLELARLVKERDPLTKVVVLTAYPEFEYAQKSVQLGVHNFLLKPLNPEEVLTLAVELKSLIDRETAHWNEYLQLQAQLKESADQLKERFLNDLLSGAANPEQLDQRYDYFFAVPFGSFCTVAVMEAETDPDKGEEDRLLSGMACKRIVEVLLAEHGDIHVFQDNGGRVVLLNRDPETDVTKVGEQCIRAVADKLSIQASVGVGSLCTSLNRVKEAYREALEALRYGKLTGGGQVISFGEDIRFVEGGWEPKFSELDDILFFIKAGVEDQAGQAIERLFASITASKGTAIEQAQAMVIHFISLLMYVLSELGLAQMRPEWLNGSLYNRVFGVRSVAELKVLVTEIAKEATAGVHKNRSKKKNRIVDEVKEYIAQEIHNPELSLASISRNFHLNASYFSRIFKQETGQGLTEYLLKLRMETAVRLLKETDWKAYQIAEKVGIKDPYYFSHCFKKVMGVSIQEFKRAGDH